MTRLLKWMVVPAVVVAGLLLASPGEAKAQGFGISVYSGYGGYPGYYAPYVPRYGYHYGYRPYGYSAFYGHPYYRGHSAYYVAPRVYRPYGPFCY